MAGAPPALGLVDAVDAPSPTGESGVMPGAEPVLEPADMEQPGSVGDSGDDGKEVEAGQSDASKVASSRTSNADAAHLETTAVSAPSVGAQGEVSVARSKSEQDPVVVTGAIVLGLLPYTIAAGAFGLGTTVGLDAYSDAANVGFGPTASLGVTDWLTLGAAVPFASSPVEEERITGLGNVGVSAQFLYFNDASSGISLAATPGVTLPSPSPAASSDVSSDLKASGAINVGAVAVNLTARGAVKVPTTSEQGEEAVPMFDSALSLILVNDTIAPFLEGGITVAEELVPIGAAGLNWAPGGGALLTVGVPVAFHEDRVQPGMSFTAYFETDLFGQKQGISKATAMSIATSN